jgi:HSP20 family protein
MYLTRWEPFSTTLPDLWQEMSRIQREFDRIFRDLGFDFGLEDRWPRLVGLYPPLNIWEDDNCLYVEAEVPGMSLEDLEIYVTGGNQLTIRGERKAPQVEKGTWHRRERAFGSFTRVVTLPVEVDANKVEAKLHHGVLLITLPKTEAARARKIPVKAE